MTAAAPRRVEKMPKLTADELHDMLAREFPQIRPYGFRIEAVGDRGCRLRLPMTDAHLRPGGTVSGPAMMTLVDCAMYVAVMAALGPVTQAVTSNLNISFLRRPRPVDQVAEVRVLKLGHRLANGDALVFSDGLAEPVAHATLTYALPEAS